MQRVLISIDDTDALGTPGTGELLENIAKQIKSCCLGNPTFISRHQLLVHPDVPFTSHNSSMAIEIKDAVSEEEILSLVVEEVSAKSAEGSDPGVCLCNIQSLSEDDAGKLKKFGYNTKTKIMTKESAYTTAGESGVILKELGGTGDGVIGALAGLGLRLSGNDGRVKGKFLIDTHNNLTTIANILDYESIDSILVPEGKLYNDSDIVYISGHIKTVVIDGRRVLPLGESTLENAVWKTMTKDEIKMIY
jgi:hypothetical protein